MIFILMRERVTGVMLTRGPIQRDKLTMINVLKLLELSRTASTTKKIRVVWNVSSSFT